MKQPTLMQSGIQLIINKMINTKYRCNICNYIFDPDEGDRSNGINPGTSFDDVPDYWTCPICGAPKSEFVLFD
jgi:rubredoxin